jgi:hypothetical protein
MASFLTNPDDEELSRRALLEKLHSLHSIYNSKDNLVGQRRTYAQEALEKLFKIEAVTQTRLVEVGSSLEVPSMQHPTTLAETLACERLRVDEAQLKATLSRTASLLEMLQESLAKTDTINL